MSTHHSSSAFVVGITGHMDIPEADLPEIEDRLHLLFRWLRQRPDAVGDFPAWWPTIGSPDTERPLPGLGLQNRHIVLLTSLAPGADTIAARIALKEGIEVRAPLPFPANVYLRATTFTGAPDPAQAVEDFQSLIGGAIPQVETFPVSLASDVDLSAEERERVFEADLESNERRNLRYRAAGEYVATSCDLLFAFFQPAAVNGDVGSIAGTQTIVDIARTGPTPGILPDAEQFTHEGAVPVIHVPCRSEKRQKAAGAEFSEANWRSIRAKFLPPLWLGDDNDQFARAGI